MNGNFRIPQKKEISLVLCFFFLTVPSYFRKDPVRVVVQNILVHHFISCVFCGSEPVNVHVIHII